MDIDKWKNNFLTSHNTGTKNADIESKFYSWYAIFIFELLPTYETSLLFVYFICCYVSKGLKIKGSLTSCEHT